MAKAEQTRALLERCALDLFARQGYAETTVTQIAAAARVSHMTFFRHFPTKESVVLGDPYDPLIGESVAAQPRRLPPLERVRRGLARAAELVPTHENEYTRTRIRIVAAEPSLRAGMWENNRKTHEVIAAALEADGVPTLAANVAAGACLGALMAALLDWAVDERGTLRDRIQYALEQLAPVTVETASG